MENTTIIYMDNYDIKRDNNLYNILTEDKDLVYITEKSTNKIDMIIPWRRILYIQIF